jgi:hypothetical protein
LRSLVSTYHGTALASRSPFSAFGLGFHFSVLRMMLRPLRRIYPQRAVTNDLSRLGLLSRLDVGRFSSSKRPIDCYCGLIRAFGGLRTRLVSDAALPAKGRPV